mmetsp:Transcript_18757/g.19000  ORF Transcript_18757/g.19000 Transcript_18757/m.19000 type:complete len:115 (+) Transcript_18757:178-522(+)
MCSPFTKSSTWLEARKRKKLTLAKCFQCSREAEFVSTEDCSVSYSSVKIEDTFVADYSASHSSDELAFVVDYFASYLSDEIVFVADYLVPNSSDEIALVDDCFESCSSAEAAFG